MQTTLELAEGAASNAPETGLRAVAALRALTERLEILQVGNARKLGWSWQDIATRLRVTKQTVHRQQGHRIGSRYCPSSSPATPGRFLFARPSRRAASGTASSAASTCCTALPPP